MVEFNINEGLALTLVTIVGCWIVILWIWIIQYLKNNGFGRGKNG